MWLEEGKYKHTRREQKTEGRYSVIVQSESETLTLKVLTWNIPLHCLLLWPSVLTLTWIPDLDHQDWNYSLSSAIIVLY